MADQTVKQAAKHTITFKYLKSGVFRVIKVDGAIGGLTPRGDIVMSMFNERPALPDLQEYEILEDGGLKFLSQEKTTEGLIREIEIAISLRPEVALATANWLMSKVRQFEQQAGVKLSINKKGVIEIEDTSPTDTKNEV